MESVQKSYMGKEMNPSKHNKFLIGNYAPPSIEVTRGKGSFIWDSTGKKYLDFASGIAVTNVGHSHPTWVESFQKQAAELVHCSNLFSIPQQVSLAEQIVSKIGPGKVLFCNSGAEANEALIKLSRLFGNQSEKQRTNILVATNGFHGRTMGALSATESKKYRQGFEPLLPGFTFCRYNDLAHFESSINDKTAAILIESIQGEGGLEVATDSFLIGIEKLCTKHNLLFLIDEVQAGIARTGNFLGYQESGVQPHAIAMAKGLGGGFPIGAIWVNDSYSPLFTPGSHGTTYGGSPLACTAALAVLKIIEEEGLVEKANNSGKKLREGLECLTKRFPSIISHVKGRGLMLGLGLLVDPSPLVANLREKGLIAVGAANNTLRLLPPLTVSNEEIEDALDMIEAGLNAIASN